MRRVCLAGFEEAVDLAAMEKGVVRVVEVSESTSSSSLMAIVKNDQGWLIVEEIRRMKSIATTYSWLEDLIGLLRYEVRADPTLISFGSR